MRRFQFGRGAEFIWKSQTFRVVRLLEDGMVNIENSTGRFETVALWELIKKYFLAELVPKDGFINSNDENRNSANKASVNKIYVKEFSDYTPSQQKEAKRRKKILDDFLEDPKYHDMSVEQYLEHLSNNTDSASSGNEEEIIDLAGSLSRPSFYRWMGIYILNHKDIRCLCHNNYARGGAGKSRFGEVVDEIIAQVFEEMLFSRQGYTAKQARPKLPSAKKLYLEIKRRITTKNEKAKPPLRIPSKRTIERRVEIIPKFDLCVAQYGLQAAKREFRQYGQNADVPFMRRVEFDHTTVDVIVIDDIDGMPLGRPTLTTGHETSISMMTAASLTFEPGSYLTAKQALYQTIMPKDDITDKYGTKNKWLICGLFDEMGVDNAPQFVGGDMQDVCMSLGIRLVPTEGPTEKGGEESAFKTANQDLFHEFHGTTFSNILERGDYDSVGASCIMESELQDVFIKYVVDILCQEPRGKNKIIPSLALQSLYDEGYVPSLPFSPLELEIILGRTAYRTLHHYGIELFNLRYNIMGNNRLGEIRKTIDELYKKNQIKNRYLKIKWYPENLRYIDLLDPFEGGYIRIPCLNETYIKNNMSYWKHRVVQREAKRKYGFVDEISIAESYRYIQNVISNARKRQLLSARTRIGRWRSADKTTTDPVVATLTNLPESQPVNSSNTVPELLPHDEKLQWLNNIRKSVNSDHASAIGPALNDSNEKG